uniref:Uncharacterized protein n=1 Tax=Quercus lobata TaxID=97700 RepID=A0A7N2L0I6_QUELO
MDLKNLCCSGSKTIQLGECYQEVESANLPSTRSNNKLKWRVLWLKLKKERRKIFESPAPTHIPYDAYTYSQNFDQGPALDEPDSLSRSFSIRFADPSRIFREEEVV